ncbi:MAG TPA: deoxyribodipyrimidine photo-lyase [Mesorhizobium sp.]|jgi:deoxyribodipyrimidine photo-lyase|uniref:cryptochrome/photolyase family protein n=1 Tax=Mesorhizobium sp. TaxID=1871066 RepID=UPI002DDD4BF5|nr:deoxyribodipyrimidine photo-lyase [Mesorhizobium sp.]HEV2503666.1 deoxyribodipyrimidine photo-lyase [Mesorhizobium sp.]
MASKTGFDDDNDRPAIVWFRDDLRLGDNPALTAAATGDREIICIFVHDEESDAIRPLGGAARWWLHGALQELADDLQRLGGQLWIYRGPAAVVVPQVANANNAAAVYWNRRYGLGERHADETVKSALKAQRIEARSFNGHLLYEPWSIRTGSDGPFRVFSAFWRTAHEVGAPERPLGVPAQLRLTRRRCASGPEALDLARLALEPGSPDWAKGLRANWRRGEAAAQAALQGFLQEHLTDYADIRDFPDRAATSKLSPYLRFGNISAREVWHAATAAASASNSSNIHRSLEKFQSELGWREFSYHLLYHNPQMPKQNLRPKFDQMAWRADRKALRAWQNGRTGYPLVDAGMRELWSTGWMHNRVRMVVASFLVKHLLLDWRQGESWFWDTLVDADPANNAASWQWVAGSGADAAPFFRVFNPILQGEKFDPGGEYVRRWVPELASLSASDIHRPWQASKIGKTYPEKIVEQDGARQRALDAFKALD